MQWKRWMRTICCWMVLVCVAWGSRQSAAAPPSSQPMPQKATSQPSPLPRTSVPPVVRKIGATTRPNHEPQRRALAPTVRSVVALWKRASLSAKGELWVDGKPVKLGQWALLLMRWKAQPGFAGVLLSIAPESPKSRGLIVKEMMRESGVAFRALGAVATAPTASRPVVPGPRVTPVAPVHPSLPTAAPDDSVWSKVPVMRQKASHGTRIVELRGLVLGKTQKPLARAPTALISYKGKRRKLLAVVRANAQGLFRYGLQTPAPGEIYRVSVLARDRVAEFPVPLERASGGILYLRLSVASGAGVRRGVVPPAVARLVPTQRPVPPPTTVKRCDWTKAPRYKMEGLGASGQIELRVQISMPNGKSPGQVATGLLVRKGKQHLPRGRGRTDTKGCLVYFVDGTKKQEYEIATLHGAKLHVAPVPSIRGAKAPIFVPVRLEEEAPQSTSFTDMHVFFEIADADWLQVTHVVSLFYAPSGIRPQSVSFVLPTSKGAVGFQLGNDIRKLQPSLVEHGIRIARLKPGRNQLLYSYRLPRDSDGDSKVELHFSHKVQNVLAFFTENQVYPAEGRNELKSITRGTGSGKRKFLMMQLPPSAPNQQLSLTVKPKDPPPARLIGWIGKMKRQGKNNKVLGLGVLIAITCLGLFWLLATPRRETPSEPSKSE